MYDPEESTVPHPAPPHPFPETIQLTPRLGLPAELTVAPKDRTAPSSTGIACGDTVTEISLEIAACAAALAESSAALVACTITKPFGGTTPGAL